MALRELFAQFDLAFPFATLQRAEQGVDHLVASLRRLDEALSRVRSFSWPAAAPALAPVVGQGGAPAAPVAPTRAQAALRDLARGTGNEAQDALREAMLVRRAPAPIPVPAGLAPTTGVAAPGPVVPRPDPAPFDRLRAAAGRVFDRFNPAAREAARGAAAAGNAVQRSAEQSRAAQQGFGGLAGVLGSFGVALGVAQAVKLVTNLGSELETNRAVVAGMLQQFGKTETFETGLKDAEIILKRIAVDSAALPGSADEYIEVFRSALPGVAQSMQNATVEQMAAFTNRFAAVGRSMRIDAVQLGNDLTRMLAVRGQAGIENRSFMQLLPFMRQVSGEMNLDSTKFNMKSQAARQALLEAAVNTEAMSKMVDEMSTSFDAMWGAAKQNFTMWTRAASKGLFEGIKDSLKALNDFSDRLAAATKNVNVSRIALGALAVGGFGALVAGAGMLVKRLLLVAAPALLWDDFKTTIEGGDSVLRRFLINSYGLEQANVMIGNMRDAWAQVGPAVGQTLLGVGRFFAGAAAGSAFLFGAVTAHGQAAADANWVAFNRATNGIERAFDRVIQYSGNAWSVCQIQLSYALAQMLASIDAFAVDVAMAFANIVIPGWDKISKLLFGADRSDMQKSAEQTKGDIELRRQREIEELKRRFEGQRAGDAEDARRRQSWSDKNTGRGEFTVGQRFTPDFKPTAPLDVSRAPTVPLPLAAGATNITRKVEVTDRSQTTIEVRGGEAPGETARRVGEAVGIFRRNANRTAYEAVAPAFGGPL